MSSDNPDLKKKLPEVVDMLLGQDVIGDAGEVAWVWVAPLYAMPF